MLCIYECVMYAVWCKHTFLLSSSEFRVIIIIIIINKVLIKVTLNKVIAGALYIVICG